MELQVGVKVLLKNPEGKYLVIRRAPDLEQPAKVLKWDIPGGRIHIGDDLMTNLAREVMEETKLIMTSEPRLLAAQDLMPNTIAKKHVVRLTYCGTADGTPVLSDEHTDYQWVDFEVLRGLPDLDSNLKKLIEAGTISEGSLSQ